MNLPCPIKSLCLDPADPFQNLSSEAPDAAVFIGITSGPGSIRRVPSGPGSPPAPGRVFSAQCLTTDGPFICTAPTQEEADLCVQRNSQLCNPPDGGPPPTGPGTDPTGNPTFRSNPASCTELCPDGTPFTFVLPAGAFVASSQILADREAQTFACRQARRNAVCMGPLTGNACVGQPFSEQISSSGFGVTFSVSAGALPPGILLSTTASGALLAGTPATPGNYTFNLRAVSAAGSFIEKTFTLAVLDITNPTVLPSGQTSSAYTVQLTGAGGVQPYTFAVVAGALPAGLALGATGLISGTPSLAATSNFMVQIQDANQNQCSKSFVISVAAGVGFMICNWSDILASIPGVVCSASSKPAWDGVFDQRIDSIDNPGRIYWYFLSKSIQGNKVAADESPNYLQPVPPWQDNNPFAVLSWDPGGFWLLAINCVDGTPIYGNFFISADSTDASGTYTLGAPGPSTIQIVKVQNSTCCLLTGEDITVPIPATADIARGLPQPSRVRIKNASTVFAKMGALAFCHAATTEPAWDGTFPFIDNGSPGNLHWHPNTTAQCALGTFLPLSINGKVLQNTDLNCPPGPGGACDAVINYFDFSAPHKWQILIRCIPPNTCASIPCVWQGEKGYGVDPTGTYTRANTNGSSGIGQADGPDCIEIESY